MRIAFTTLGCKINQYETDLLRQDLAARGNTIVPFDGEADVYVINTCSVTAKSDMQCRQTIRSAVRRGAGAKVVVTGCYAETRPDEIRNIPGVNLIVGNRDKSGIADHLMLSASAAPEQERDSSHVRAVSGRTRAFLKIQDGCDNRCSYCIVPLARGGSRSSAPSAVVKEFDRLARVGCPEIVLTGIHIGTYGVELSPRVSLTDLLVRLVDRRDRSRIRLSSIEPRETTEGIIRLLGNGVCRHLHIPLQSGDDSILASMKRNYTADFYRDMLERIAHEVPGIALGADVMVGFPGEGETEFRNTMRLVESVPLTHLHVFSYSPRPGTAAAIMKGQVPETIKKERSEALRRLGKEKNYAFRKKQQGVKLHVVVEDKADPKTGLLSGLTDNYIRVLICNAGRDQIGKEIPVRITEVKKDDNFATSL
jgi:threonylcarbamoyladenosine tRNA methylthiotransferase MtaB